MSHDILASGTIVISVVDSLLRAQPLKSVEAALPSPAVMLEALSNLSNRSCRLGVNRSCVGLGVPFEILVKYTR